MIGATRVSGGSISTPDVKVEVTNASEFELKENEVVVGRMGLTGPSGRWSPEQLLIQVGDETTALSTGTGTHTFRMPFAMTLTEVRASVTTAPTGGHIQVDLNEEGVSIFSTELQIDATEKTSTTAATPAIMSDTVLADDAEITIDIDAVGPTVAGAGLKVWLIGTRN